MKRSGIGTYRSKPRAASGNERGVALILALVMLMLLTLLGMWALDTSSTDLKIAGNSRNSQTAFYNADAALAYVSNPANLTNTYITTFMSNSFATATQVVSSVSATAIITFLGSGPLPAGSGYDADLDVNGIPKFHGLYFAVVTQGKAANNAEAIVEAGIVQVAGN